MTTNLILHCGAREVGEGELRGVPTPPATRSWFPVPHADVAAAAKEALAGAGFAVAGERYGLSRHDARMFAVLELGATLAPGVTLAVGLRNSLDKSFPLGFVGGSRTLVCDNLAFRGDLIVTKKHTRHGGRNFREAIAGAVTNLSQFREQEAAVILKMRKAECPDRAAESLMLRAYEQEIVNSQVLPRVIKEWREPSYGEFKERTEWSLFNAFTTALGPRMRTDPQRYAVQTARLRRLFDATPWGN